ncbi:hypothetical protein D3C85_944000 [compost metagenome]
MKLLFRNQAIQDKMNSSYKLANQNQTLVPMKHHQLQHKDARHFLNLLFRKSLHILRHIGFGIVAKSFYRLLQS